MKAPALLVVSAFFHYLGPAFAVLLFARLDVVGVAWLRIAGAAVVFALWRRSWRVSPPVVLLGVVLAAMNTVFYLAIARLPLATVGAVEFLGVVVLAAAGVRTVRNAAAVLLAVAGVFTLTEVRLGGAPLGFVLAFVNCGLFMAYIALGHRIAQDGGVDKLGTAMVTAAVVVTPVGVVGALPAFRHPVLLLAGLGVGVCSSVVPYALDQYAMALVRRSTFALLLSILPAVATVIGFVVLAQRPTVPEVVGVALVVMAVAVHQSAADPPAVRTSRGSG